MGLRFDRSAIRSLARAPAFTIPAVLSLALAVGLTSTAFGIVDAVLHPYVPYREPNRLYEVQLSAFDASAALMHDMYTSLRRHEDLYTNIAAIATSGTDVVAVNGVRAQTYPSEVSVNFFDVMGIQLFAGRSFREDDKDAPDRAGVVVSYRFWRNNLEGVMPLTRLALTVGVRSYQVIGVLPPSFQWGDVNLAMPRSTEDRAASAIPFQVFLRLRSGVPDSQLARELRLTAAGFSATYGIGHNVRYQWRSMAATPRELQPFHMALSCAAVIIFLIACANVANLMIVRVTVRRRDVAVRMALGASKGNVAEFIFSEAISLSIVGGALGLLFAMWAAHFAEYRLTMDVSQIGLVAPRFDWRVCLTALAATSATTIMISWGALNRAFDTNVVDAIKGSGATTMPTPRLQAWLATFEVALALVVLMGAGLLFRAGSAMKRYNFGFNPRNVVETQLHVPRRDSTIDATEAYYASVRNGIRALPGISGVATVYSETVPGSLVTGDADGASPRVARIPNYLVVSPDFRALLDVHLTLGRDFEAGDVDSAGSVIVDEVLAKILWPSESPIGHLIKLGSQYSHAPWVQVVGVIPPIQFEFSSDPADIGVPRPSLYLVRAGEPHFVRTFGRTLMIRANYGQSIGLVEASRYLTEIQGAPPMYQPLLSEYDRQLRLRQILASIFGAVALMGLALSAVGLYGLFSYVAAQRTREFAMRIALGAPPASIVGLVIHDAALLILGGTAIGAFLAMWSGRLMEHWLFTVSPLDAASLVGAESILIVVSLCAVIGPAYRATRADPVSLLRAT